MRRKFMLIVVAILVIVTVSACGAKLPAGEPPVQSGDDNTPSGGGSEVGSGTEQHGTNPLASVTTNGGEVIKTSSLKSCSGDTEASEVFFTSEITPEALMKIYGMLSWTPAGKVAVKLSSGEPPSSNYLSPKLIKDLVQSVNGTIVECNTAYGGKRASTAMHMQVAKDHGFTEIADFDVMDADGSMTLPVNGGSVITENFVGKNFAKYDSFLVLSHFKGHGMAGFGGAIKNISIGIASSEGKSWIHSGGTSKRGLSGKQDAFLKSMAEAGKSVSDSLGKGKNITYINVLNRISIDCDCSGRPTEPDIHDIGILASHDPVALDQASVELALAAKGSESLSKRIQAKNGMLTLQHAEALGLGKRTYRLVSLDE